jgi:hypothetical protein
MAKTQLKKPKKKEPDKPSGMALPRAVSVVLGIRASVFERPDAAEITARLGAGLTDAVGRVLGEELRDGIMVELVASPAERTFVGGRRAE